MVEHSNYQIIDILKTKTQESRQFIEQFNCHQHEVTHQNQITVQKMNSKEEELIIHNYYAIVNNQQINKITEIILQDKLITIVDVFHCLTTAPANQQQIPQKTSKNPLRNKQIAPKRKIRQSQQEYHIRDLKNIVKNLFRLFHSWLEHHTASEFQLANLFSSFLEKNRGKFNNKLVQYILKHSQLRKAFITFSEQDGEHLIQQSRINDKKSHTEALTAYRSKFLREEQKNLQKFHQQKQKINIISQLEVKDQYDKPEQ